MSEGYGKEFSRFDELTLPLKEKATQLFGESSYGNWYPFKSPKGVWMAFHGKRYGDIRIVDLDNEEIVVEGDFYSHMSENKEERVYSGHTNFSTYVPAFRDFVYMAGSPSEMRMINEDFDFDEDETLDNIQSVPIAFNAWTIWAADYEFYVDAIDLRKVDDGIIDLINTKGGWEIPRDASAVRYYIKPSIERWFRLKTENQEGGQVDEITCDFQILTGSHAGRMKLGGDLRDIYAEKGVSYGHAERPWISLKRRLEARK